VALSHHHWPPLGAVLIVSLGFGCFKGYDLEDKEPPPGYAGGFCLPEGCYDAVECLVEHNVCVDPFDPCRGIYCGGHGTCAIDMTNGNQPLCVCDLGYTNDAYAFFCS
jgi:hypothetical protein